MNAQQEAKLNMYTATEKHCDENAASFALIPAFLTAFQTFKANRATIVALTQQEDLASKGIAVDKGEAKKILCKLTADIAAPIFAYASSTSNNKLKEQVNYSYSDLLKTKDDQMAPRCQNIYDLATENLAALAPFGITAVILTTLKETIADYKDKVPTPRNAATQKATIRENQKKLFALTDSILKDQMDKTLQALKLTNPDFVTTYFKNRIIVDAAKTTTSLKGIITSAANNSFVPNATVTIGNSTYQTTTDATGQYQIKPIAAGTYAIAIAAKGYLPLSIPALQVKQGKINKKNISLTPEG
jgi:hypothetical protein